MVSSIKVKSGRSMIPLLSVRFTSLLVVCKPHTLKLFDMRYILPLLIVAVFAVLSGTASSTALKEAKNDINDNNDKSTALTAPQSAIVTTRQLQSPTAGEVEEERAWPIIRQAQSYLKSFYEWIKHFFKAMFLVETPASRKWYHFRQHLRSMRRGSRRMYYDTMGRIKSWFTRAGHSISEDSQKAKHSVSEGLQKGSHRVGEKSELLRHSVTEQAQKAGHMADRGGKRFWNFIKTGHA
ncbi:hypothetical protein Plhal304r1_c070g0158951 [Plasmopara halstedii]